MAKTSLDDGELSLLISWIVMEKGRLVIDVLLEHCHEHVSSSHPLGERLQIHENYLYKKIVYQDFDVNIRDFVCDGDSVALAIIQFRRPSRFPAPLLNRNRPLVAMLRKLLEETYSRGIEVKDNEGRRQIHFAVSSNSLWWSTSTPFERWESECAIYDDPYSSGQTAPEDTNIRNDFVVIRFQRK